MRQSVNDSAKTSRQIFPFSAIHGQPALQTALLLTAIDPLIGGVLIQGPRGTAKTTSARALAELLPKGDFVNLPLGATEEQLIGSLDIEAALQNGRVQFRPGLLAQAHLGLLYVDEVNLLADHLVDVLLDVSASGVNRIERDGISHQHDARFVLVGTMNPEEGELRPQLLDRFGLFVDLPKQIDGPTRQQIVRARLSFDADPKHFVQRFSDLQQSLQQRIVAAKQCVAGLSIADEIHQLVSDLCAEAQAEGIRADLVILRAARAHAALENKEEIEASDVYAVMEWALAHRRQSFSSEISDQQLKQDDHRSGDTDQIEGSDQMRDPDTKKDPDYTKRPGPSNYSELSKESYPSKINNSGSSTTESHDSDAAKAKQPSFSQQTSPPSSTEEDNSWGELPPETVTPELVPINTLKTVRPLPLKKR